MLQFLIFYVKLVNGKKDENCVDGFHREQGAEAQRVDEFVATQATESFDRDKTDH